MNDNDYHYNIALALFNSTCYSHSEAILKGIIKWLARLRSNVDCIFFRIQAVYNLGKDPLTPAELKVINNEEYFCSHDLFQLIGRCGFIAFH